MRALRARVDVNDLFFFGGATLLAVGLWLRFGGDVAVMVLGALSLIVGLLLTLKAK